MRKLALVLTSIVLLSFSVAAEVSSDLQNELDQLGPNDRIEVLVQTGPSMTDQHVDAISQQGELRNRYDLFDGVHLELPVPAVDVLSNLDFVESVEPNYEMGLFLSESAGQVEAETVWDYERTGEGVKTAVLDTGVHAEHSGLNVAEQVDFTGEGTGDNNGHGTHVAGIVGSQDDNNRGLAYGSNIYDVKVLNEDGQGSGSDLLDGMEWVVNNDMQVAVLSLGAAVEDCDGDDILSRAVDDMTDEGVFVAVAAGNEGPEDETITIPGCSREGTTVGSVDKNDRLADYSSRGPTSDGRAKPDVVAPGTIIESTWNDGGFNTISGTSMATPHVAGQAALLLEEEDNSLTPRELKDVIISTSTDLGLERNEQGSGRINVSESFFQISDEEREEQQKEEEQEEENEETEEKNGDETEEDRDDEEQAPDQEMPGAEARAEGRIRFGPDSMFYGLRVASDRAAVSLGFKTRQDVMKRRAQEARQMQEQGNNQAAERALSEMRRSAGSSENATREAEETLERVIEDAPEEAKEGLRNSLRNVEEKGGQRTQRQDTGDRSNTSDRAGQEEQERGGEQVPKQPQDHEEREEIPEQSDEDSETLGNIEESVPEQDRTEERKQHQQDSEQGNEDSESLNEREAFEQDQVPESTQEETGEDQTLPQKQQGQENSSEKQDQTSQGRIGQFFRDNLRL